MFATIAKSPGWAPRSPTPWLTPTSEACCTATSSRPNLILDPLGNIWVTDFGLAKFEEGDDLSQSHDLVGTLRYMAPERFRGVSDRRGDVYAWVRRSTSC